MKRGDTIRSRSRMTSFDNSPMSRKGTFKERSKDDGGAFTFEVDQLKAPNMSPFHKKSKKFRENSKKEEMKYLNSLNTSVNNDIGSDSHPNSSKNLVQPKPFNFSKDEFGYSKEEIPEVDENPQMKVIKLDDCNGSDDANQDTESGEEETLVDKKNLTTFAFNDYLNKQE